jgi:hypothetical protein
MVSNNPIFAVKCVINIIFQKFFINIQSSRKQKRFKANIDLNTLFSFDGT